MEQQKGPEAKCGTVVICLLAVILGQVYLLRHIWMAGFSAWPPAMIGELIFCVVMLGAVIWCWEHPKGWSTNKGCAAALILFGIYLIYTLIFFQEFSALYLSGINTEFPSSAKALVAAKLLLALLAVIAGIPAAKGPEGREYAEKLRQAVYRQEAEWAKGSAVGAKKDLDAAMEKLRQNLSQEEIDALLEQLKAEKAAQPGSEAAGESVAEDWRGWGGGV